MSVQHTASLPPFGLIESKIAVDKEQVEKCVQWSAMLHFCLPDRKEEEKNRSAPRRKEREEKKKKICRKSEEKRTCHVCLV